MSVIESQITGNLTDGQQLIQADHKKITAPHSWPLSGEFTCDQWFPSQRASNAESISISWCHHIFLVCGCFSECRLLIKYIKIMHMDGVLLCLDINCFYPYSSRVFHWQRGNHMMNIIPVINPIKSGVSSMNNIVPILSHTEWDISSVNNTVAVPQPLIVEVAIPGRRQHGSCRQPHWTNHQFCEQHSAHLQSHRTSH